MARLAYSAYGTACVSQSCRWEETDQTNEVKLINDSRPGPLPHVYVLKCCCGQSLLYKIIFHCTTRCSLTFRLSILYECFILICKQPNRIDKEWYSVLLILCGGGAREHGEPPPLWEKQKPYKSVNCSACRQQLSPCLECALIKMSHP